ncbi:MAG: RecX family transcriptional regulator [Flavobacteriales bacterium]|nr:RecX family transcriptional regulator [Flavobacteriales bacterium]
MFLFREELKKIQRYCSYQDRCQYEVEVKLNQFKLDQEEKEEIIIRLIEEGFLDEERFVRSFIRGKFYQKKWGIVKIKKELVLKKVPKNLITNCLDEINQEDYKQTARELYEKKYKNLEGEHVQARKLKCLRYLVSKGYETSLIYEFMDKTQ